MWARSLSRVSARLVAAAGWSRTAAQLHRGFRSCGRYTGVSAGRGAYSDTSQVLGVLLSYRSYTARTPDTESTDYESSYTENGAEPENDEPLPEFNIKVLVNLLRQENGKDLCVIRVPSEMKYVEYFVVVGGTSTRHLQAMAQYTLKVYKYLKKESDPHVCLEGKDTDDWMCIDFGNIVIHFMLPEARETYELEKLWTLRSYDDQLSDIVQEVLPLDFTFGLHQHKE